MHLLVLSAFRHHGRVHARVRSVHVSMHLLVPSAFRRVIRDVKGFTKYVSQCTFWCSVLSDRGRPSHRALHAASQCTFWCLVPSDSKDRSRNGRKPGLNAPSGAWCFPTNSRPTGGPSDRCLNAPSGAWCFPTLKTRGRSDTPLSGCLNAPSGAWCFPTEEDFDVPPSELYESQCTFWCLVLSDSMEFGTTIEEIQMSQCTFWCLVLSDPKSMDDDIRHACLNAPSGAWCFPTPPPENRATTPFTGTKSPPTWKAPHRIGPHLSN